LKAPPRWKVKKVLRSKVTLHKISESTIDDEFGQTEETETTIEILADIQPVTLEDMLYLPPGYVSQGDAWGFFLPVYQKNGLEYFVEVNDYISFKGVKYLVQRIDDAYEGDTVVVRRAYLKRQVGV